MDNFIRSHQSYDFIKGEFVYTNGNELFLFHEAKLIWYYIKNKPKDIDTDISEALFSYYNCLDNRYLSDAILHIDTIEKIDSVNPLVSSFVWDNCKVLPETLHTNQKIYNPAISLARVIRYHSKSTASIEINWEDILQKAYDYKLKQQGFALRLPMLERKELLYSSTLPQDNGFQTYSHYRKIRSESSNILVLEWYTLQKARMIHLFCTSDDYDTICLKNSRKYGLQSVDIALAKRPVIEYLDAICDNPTDKPLYRKPTLLFDNYPTLQDINKLEEKEFNPRVGMRLSLNSKPIQWSFLFECCQEWMESSGIEYVLMPPT